jgi:hypothetical protein
MATDRAWDSAAADALCAAVDSGRMMGHLHEFARRVKLSGTPEELASFRYLEAEMAAAGFSTKLLSHDAYISLPLRAEVRAGGETLRCITHSMSRPTAGLTAPLVYVGKGDAAAFAAHDAAGAIALVDGIAMEDVAAAASRAGAAGVIHISPTEHLYEMCVSPVWGSPSQLNRGDLPTVAICTIPHDAGAGLRRRAQAGERIEAFMATVVATHWRKTPLLVAELGGADEPFVLFAGHHDTWHYGVMDNGSANATMLEAVGLLAQAQPTWRRGLRVCFFSGHSHGRYSGSAWYADEAFEDLDRRCVAYVNIDSTGAAGATEMTRSAVIDELKAVAAEAVASVAGSVHAGNRHGRVADMSFWGVGLPSMFGSLSYQPRGPGDAVPRLGWWWHTPHDLIEHIDPANLVRDTAIVLRVLHRLLTSPVLPLDYAACADSLLGELAKLEGTALDLGGLSAAAEKLKRNAAALPACAAPPEAVNRALMRLSRALVPLNYTSGDRFRPDPALDQPPWPALEGLRELAAQPADSPDLPFYLTEARRTRNRLAHALRLANQALEDVLATVSTEMM